MQEEYVLARGSAIRVRRPNGPPPDPFNGVKVLAVDVGF
jgi:hypothetical protein